MSTSSLRTLRSCFRQIARRIISVSVSLAETEPAALSPPFCVASSPRLADISRLLDLTRFMSVLMPLPRRLNEALWLP